MKVYVAGPYSSNPVRGLQAAIDAADQVVARGHCPFIPHVSLVWDLVSPRPYEFWLAYDLVWLASCDVVLRLPGDSMGADGEVKAAEFAGIPVIYSVIDLPLEPSPL